MAKSGNAEIFSMMGTMITLAIVIGLAWVLIKWLSKRVPTQSSSRHIKLLDRVAVSPDKCLLLVKVAEKTMLVAMTSHAIEKLCDVDELDETPPVQAPSFRALFTQRMQAKEADE